MKRIALFTEGESDMIFASYLIKTIFECKGIQIKYINYKSDENFQRDVKSQEIFEEVGIEFEIWNLGNDKRVVDKLAENAPKMIRDQYDSVYGLRDLYSEEYDRQSDGKIVEEISQKTISLARSAIEKTEYEGKVKLYYSVMELEAWYLELYQCLERAGCNPEKLNEVFGKEASTNNPEQIYHPKKILKKIFPSTSEVNLAHKIGSKVLINDLNSLKDTREKSFLVEFINAIESFKK